VPTGFVSDAAAIISAQQPVTPFANVTLQLEQGGFSMFNALRTNAISAPASGSVPNDSWVCVEWEVVVATAGAVRLSVAGMQLSAPAIADDTTTTPPIGELAFGMSTFAGAGDVPARDLWLDELVVSNSPVGCPF
jgi:hypothetical protein